MVFQLAPLLFLLALTNDPELLAELVDAVIEAHQPGAPPPAELEA